MDNIKLSSTELLHHSSEKSTAGKLQDEVFNFVKERSVESLAGGALLLAAGAGGLFKLASREAAKVATAKLETEGLQVGTERVKSGLDVIGKIIDLGPKDAGKITEAKIGDIVDVSIPFGKIRPFPGFFADNKNVLEIIEAGYGPEESRTIFASYRVIGPGEAAIDARLPGQRFHFPIKAN